MPPGTGDTQLTLAQKVPVTGAVIVTTPQDIALIDARKGLKMFEKVSIPILGIVENMSIHICSKCGHDEHIFGTGGGEQMCKDYDVEFLGACRSKWRSARWPTLASRPWSAPRIHPPPRSTAAIARRMAVKIAEKAKDMTVEVPEHRRAEHLKGRLCGEFCFPQRRVKSRFSSR